MGAGMVIDGVAASEAVDSSGERIVLKGLDISEFEEGRGTLNYEHRGDDSPGASGNDIVGEITYSKKIFNKGDCEDDRQLGYWERVRLPFLYIRAELFDGDGDHAGAKSLAAVIRHYKTRGKQILVRYSVEGSTIKKTGNLLKECIARRCALTVKPCNRSCFSDVMEDPNAPDGPVDYDRKKDLLDFEEDAKKSESDNPMYQRLGGTFVFEGDPELDDLSKTMTAGGTGGAPSTLTGTAPLSPEDSSFKKMRGSALAAVRDYPGSFARDKFRTFAKSRLPEASDAFLDHFTDIAEDYHVKRKLAKKEGGAPIVEKKPAPKTKAKPAEKPAKAAPSAASETPKTKAKAKAQPSLPGLEVSHQSTIRGVPIQSNPTLKKPVFDEEKGILHAPFGSFPLYVPPAEHFNKILSDPKVEEVHNQAMAGWVKVHKLLKEGRLPPEVVMHATMFSNLSPNTPVPVQEMMYSHLVDSMHATGADPREPGFSEKTKGDWTSRDKAKGYPEHSREFFTDHPGVHLKNNSTRENRKAGDLAGFMLANNKMLNMDKYHQNHQHYMDLINGNGSDVRKTAEELMRHKNLAQLWENKRQTALSSGKPDIGDYQGPTAAGLAPKTTRYMLGMVGGGNVFVPDTHMVRHLSGLEQGKDGETNEEMKKLMWNELNSPILSGIDRWYAKNHPAVQHMLNHPTWGKHFEQPEDAIFPAFWKHWIAIAPDERSRGMRNQNATEGTTHAPFWSAIDPFVDGVKKSEIDETLPERTARIHAQYVRDYGEVPASMLYHAFLLPHLLDAAEQRAKRGTDLTFMAKSDQLDISLRKAVADFESHPTLLEPEMPAVHRVHMKIGEKHHPAGRYMILGGQVSHLEDYHGIIGKFLPEGPVNESTVSRIHGLRMSPHLRIEDDDMARPEQHTEDAHPPILPTAPSAPRKPSVFHYTRVGHDRPHTLEVQNGHYLLDGKKMSYPEVQTIVGNLKTGAATIRYRNSEVAEKIRKMEDSILEMLAKADPGMDPSDALQHIRAAVAAGHVHPDVERALTAHLFQDPMTSTPGSPVGNKYAWEQFKAKNKPGAYLSLDMNGMKAVNDAYGHETGDHAIKAYTGAVRRALDSSVGRDMGKMWRAGGDEVSVYAPSHEHAAKFARALHQEFEKIPAINGVHKLSASVGIGHDFSTADKAMYEAKKQKFLPGTTTPAFKTGQVPTLVHSLSPGHEGPMPMHSENAAALHQVSMLPAPASSTSRPASQPAQS